MGRTNREDFAYAFHHVMNRAGARRWIFTKDEHRMSFLDVLAHVVKVDEIQIHAYCLMGNHFHLLLRTPHHNLSNAMQRLGSMFTRRFNRSEKVDGPLFRSRFKSRIVGHDEYLRQLCRYIHRNPVAAGLVKKPEDYNWSSYPVYAGLKEAPGWLTDQELPTYFPGPCHLDEMRSMVESTLETDIDKMKAEELFKYISTDANGLPVPSRCIQQPERVPTQNCALPKVRLNKIIFEVSSRYGIEKEELFAFKPRLQNVPRDLSMFLASIFTEMTSKEVADAFAVSRTTTSSAVARIRKALMDDVVLRNRIEEIKVRIYS